MGNTGMGYGTRTGRLLATGLLTTGLMVGATMDTNAAQGIEKRAYGKMADGRAVDLYVLTNAKGVEATITSYGGTVVTLKVPDKAGQLGDVVLGLTTLDDYVKRSPYFGCLVGRYGNRIAKGQFTLDGKEYTLAMNNGPNHLHGGDEGLRQGRSGTAKPVAAEDGVALELDYTSKDGEEGYPGDADGDGELHADRQRTS